MRHRTWPALSLAALILAAGCGARPEHTDRRVVKVAAAADLQFAFKDIRTDFQKQHPDIEVQVTYGSSGNFFAQLANKAPFDVFFSADRDYPRRLIDGGPKSRAGNRTVSFPADIVPELADHIERFVGPDPHALVFVGPKGATLRRSNFRPIWNAACEQAGVPGLHFHDLHRLAARS